MSRGHVQPKSYPNSEKKKDSTTRALRQNPTLAPHRSIRTSKALTVIWSDSLSLCILKLKVTLHTLSNPLLVPLLLESVSATSVTRHDVHQVRSGNITGHLCFLRPTEQDVQAAARAAVKDKRWLSSVKVGTQDEGNTLEEALDDELFTKRAFESTDEDHSEFCLAADYTDKRFNDRREAFRVCEQCTHVTRRLGQAA